MIYMMMFMFLAGLAIPAAAKVIAVAVVVYAVMQSAKQSPWFGPWLVGWWAVLFNAGLTIVGIVMGTQADQLYSMATLQQILTAIFMSSGIHGMASKLGPAWIQGPPQAPPAPPKVGK